MRRTHGRTRGSGTDPTGRFSLPQECGVTPLLQARALGGDGRLSQGHGPAGSWVSKPGMHWLMGGQAAGWRLTCRCQRRVTRTPRGEGQGSLCPAHQPKAADRLRSPAQPVPSPVRETLRHAWGGSSAGPHMAPGGPRPALLLPLALLAAGLALAAGESRYEKFLRQHVDAAEPSPPDAGRYCSRMMQRRAMATAGHCKHLNTFVHARAEQIQPVCGDGGRPAGGDLRLSTEPFPLTVCQLQGRARPPDCHYAGASSTSRVVIACADGQPVHFQTQVDSQAGEGDEL
ncbi:uncharacterized protein LOC142825350 [Pelodiscus sinensis]|uniref:uncharacterized protein LOC142825350 n=1 Tax=Pelodiscus sinensis TaxID=13735 RepID=UPI003F6C26C2